MPWTNIEIFCLRGKCDQCTVTFNTSKSNYFVRRLVPIVIQPSAQERLFKIFLYPYPSDFCPGVFDWLGGFDRLKAIEIINPRDNKPLGEHLMEAIIHFDRWGFMYFCEPDVSQEHVAQ